MNIDSLLKQITDICKVIISFTFIVLLAITGIEALGWNIPSISGIPMNQGSGIFLAGLGFLLSKI